MLVFVERYAVTRILSCVAIKIAVFRGSTSIHLTRLISVTVTHKDYYS